MTRLSIRTIGAGLVAASLLVGPPASLAQSQASKTGTGLPRQAAGAASGQNRIQTTGSLSTGAVAAAIGLAVVVGIGVAIASSGGGSSASSTN